MSSNNKLASAVPCHGPDQLYKFLLQLRRHAVFRFVQTIERVILKPLFEVLHGSLTVAVQTDFFADGSLKKLSPGHRFSAGQKLKPQVFIVIHPVEANALSVLQFRPGVLGRRLLFLDLLIIRPHCQHIIKNIVTGNDPAARGDSLRGAGISRSRFPAFRSAFSSCFCFSCSLFRALSRHISTGTRVGTKQLPRVERRAPFKAQPLRDQVQQGAFP